VFVVFEGIDGSGKSTLQAALAQRLRAQGQRVLETQEPGGTALGKKVRELFLESDVGIAALPAALMLNAARAQHVAEVILPALAAGAIVLCDRFTDSTLAYQGFGFGLDLERVRSINEIATGGLQPDLVFVLDVPLAVAAERMQSRQKQRKDRIEKQADELQLRVRTGFLELAESPRHRLLDGTLPEQTLVDVALDAIAAVRVA
jgi:dTMP kinase